VGLLCGLEAWRRERVSLPWRGAWVPLGAGVALLAMLGSGGEDVDYGAHILGMLAGMGLGYVAAPRLSPHPPGRGIQILSGFSALALLGASWLCAWTFVH
jgi:rhomboid protease GluP